MRKSLRCDIKPCIPPGANKCPCQSAQKDRAIFGDCGDCLSLTLLRKSGKVIKTNTMMKTSTRYHPFSESCRLVQGSRRTALNSFLSGSAEISVGGDGCARYCANGLLGLDEAAVLR